MNKQVITSTCFVRLKFGFSCRMCEYSGDTCEQFKIKNNINRPSDLFEGNTGGYNHQKSSRKTMEDTK